jgi:uncharacterized membrane protein HdeD (DUF308 family)
MTDTIVRSCVLRGRFCSRQRGPQQNGLLSPASDCSTPDATTSRHDRGDSGPINRENARRGDSLPPVPFTGITQERLAFMSAETSARSTAVNGIRTALGVGGVIALIVGIIILVWPGHAAVALTAVIAAYAIVAGLVYAGLGIFSKTMGGWSRVGHIILGIVFVIAGIIAFTELAIAAAWLALFIGVLVGIMWIVEGVVALTTLGSATSKGWSLFFAILSIIAGIILLFSPLWGAIVLWWLMGISLVVLGIIQIVRAFTFKTA